MDCCNHHMIKIKKIITCIVLFNLIGIILASLVSAWGVSSSYWEPDNPLRMMPGESKDVDLRLQNMVGDEDLTLEARLSEGSEIATITDSDLVYYIPAGKDDVKINIKISIPENTPLGTKYRVGVSLKEVTEDEGGMVQIAGKIVKSFPILVGEEVTPPTPSPPKDSISKNKILLIIFAIVIIVIIIYFALKKKN